MSEVVKLAEELVSIPSITGNEGEVAERVATELEQMGLQVERQIVEKGRPNLFARGNSDPKILFCSHLDTVPPHIPPSIQDGVLFGRGSCDAKGIIAAQIVAAKRLIEEGVDSIGFLYVVGEEVDHSGAIKAAELGLQADYIIVGEPTEGKIARGSKGIVKCKIETSGKSGHSAYPERGESAVLKLLDVIDELRKTSWPVSETLGETNWNLGTISGGVAANVIPGQAEAELLFRTVSQSDGVWGIIQKAVEKRGKVTLETMNDPIILEVVSGFEETVVSFNTDAPYLSDIGKPILFGPGSILDAHSDDEKITLDELNQGVEDYVRIVRQLLGVEK